MKRLFFEVGLAAAALFFAVLSASSTRPVGAADGPARQGEGPQQEANPATKVLAGETAIEVNCPVGELGRGEVKFPRKLPRVPLVFLIENRQTGAFVVFKADEVTTEGFKWAGCKVWGAAEYNTNLAWLAVFPDAAEPDKKAGFPGEWLHDGKEDQPCAIFQQGRVLLLVNEKGESAAGRITETDKLVVLKGWDEGLTGELAKDGKAINWSNGSTWKRP